MAVASRLGRVAHAWPHRPKEGRANTSRHVNRVCEQAPVPATYNSPVTHGSYKWAAEFASSGRSSSTMQLTALYYRRACQPQQHKQMTMVYLTAVQDIWSFSERREYALTAHLYLSTPSLPARPDVTQAQGPHNCKAPPSNTCNISIGWLEAPDTSSGPELLQLATQRNELPSSKTPVDMQPSPLLQSINQSIKTQDQQCQWPNKPRPQTQGS